MISHPLDALLNPLAVALVGVSDKPSSPGRVLFEMVAGSAYQGKIYLVNPGYKTIEDYTCYADLASLPETVEHVILAVGNDKLEQNLVKAISHGAKAATIYSSCYLENDITPPLRQRLKDIAEEAGLLICGGNGMGFYNVRDGLYAGIFPRAKIIPAGGISFIAQSGSAFTALAHNGHRLKFNLCVSSGNEMVTSAADYMDWALAQDETRVIGLFLEAVRDPVAFVAALQKSIKRRIPVVVLKIGKSPLGAKMALTHTGALAGNHAAFAALFERYGVIEVADLDEMAATLMMFQSGREAGPGSLATIQESGGLLEMVADLAQDLNVGFADIESNTQQLIQLQLDPGLVAGNPLDAWGSHDRYEERFRICMSLLMKDPTVSVGIFFSNFRDGYYLSEAFYRIMLAVSKETNKPIAFANCYSDLAHDQLSQLSCANNIPFIDGAREALLAARHLFSYRDFHLQRAQHDKFLAADSKLIEKWRGELSKLDSNTLGESDALALLADFKIKVPHYATANTQAALIQAAQNIGYPLVLKTATRGVNHKSDARGVIVNIQNETDLLHHYRDISERLGADVLVSKMIGKGTEIGLGMVNDPQFGPLIMVAAGGVLIELLSDRKIALAPVSARQADDMLSGLTISQLIDGMRGQAPVNRQALIGTITALSSLALALEDVIEEIDINPVIVDHDDAFAVDALILLKSAKPHR